MSCFYMTSKIEHRTHYLAWGRGLLLMNLHETLSLADYIFNFFFIRILFSLVLCVLYMFWSFLPSSSSSSQIQPFPTYFVFFFLNPQSPVWCCISGCVVDLTWSMLLEKIDTPSPISYLQPVAPWLAVGLIAYLPKMWFRLSLHCSCICSITTMSYYMQVPYYHQKTAFPHIHLHLAIRIFSPTSFKTLPEIWV